ncbi:MAG: M13 family peptidase, partial [Terriglobales bacterium]
MRTPVAVAGAILLALFPLACSRSAPPAPAAAPTGVDLTALDTKISPCQDFYQYACGNWIAQNPVPADQSLWGTFEKLQESNDEVLHQILDQVSAHPPAQDPVAQQVGDYYTACMNQTAIDAAGIKPLQSELDIIASLKSKDELGAEVARLQLGGADVLFSFGSDQDFKNANDMIAEADQGGIALPDRDYYTKTDAKSVTLRRQYAAHVQKMFELLGDATPRAATEARTVLRVETALAQASLTNVVRRDPNA